MKTSMVLGITAGALALTFGLLFVIPASASINDHENFDYDEYYQQAIENGEDPVHPETFGWQNSFLVLFRNLGIIALIGGAFGLTGGLLVKKRQSIARGLIIAGAVFSFLSLFGIINGILFVVAVVKLNRGD